MKKFRIKTFLKFIIPSILGVVIFFVPVFNGNTPLVWCVSLINDLLGKGRDIIAVCAFCIMSVCILLSLSKRFPKLDRFFQDDGRFTKFSVIFGSLIGALVLSGAAPDFIMNPAVGPEAVNVGCTIFVTILIAGCLVMMLAEFGLLQFVGAFLEPLMRPIYKLPGSAAVDSLASFVCAPSVGVLLTNSIYCQKLYTGREAASIATNFSVCSLGFFAALTAWGGIEHLYSKVVLSSFVIVFLIAVVMIRIPPLSRIPSVYIDGSPLELQKAQLSYRGVGKRAISMALAKAEQCTGQMVVDTLKGTIIFTIKVSVYAVTLCIFALSIAEYTPVFNWLAYPFTPILNWLHVPEAAVAAPSVMVGLIDMALPVIFIMGKELPEAAIFFVTVLSTVQIVFLAESGVAVLESKIPLNIGKMVVIFLERTIICIPLVALAMHLLL